MSFGAGALKVGGAERQSGKARRYPWQPCKRQPPKNLQTPRCLEKGGTREQGGMGPPTPTTPSTSPKR